MKSKTTVILITYNQERFIEEALFGILNQTVSPYQVIILDDASTDNTFVNIQNFVFTHPNCSNWTIKQHHINHGIVGNINIGLKLSQGENIVLMAGDDVSFPDRIELSEELLKSTGCPCICTSGVLINEFSNVIGSYDYRDGDIKANLHHLIRKGFSGALPVGLAFRKTIISNFGLLPENVPNEDDQIIFRAFILGGIYFSSHLTYSYRLHSNSASSWIRKSSVPSFIKSFVDDLRIRLKHFENWKLTLNHHNISSPVHVKASNLLDKKILFYQYLCSSNTSFFRSLILALTSIDALCLRELIFGIFGPRIYFYLLRVKNYASPTFKIKN